MKIKLVSLLLILLSGVFSAFSGNLDNKGLILSGTYSEWERDTTYSSEIKGKVIRWTAKLRMEFVNNGKEPIILIAPYQEFQMWQKKTYFSTQLLNDSGEYVKYNFSKETKENHWNEYHREKISKEINSFSPPANLTWIIEPGDSLIFYDTLKIDQEFKEKEIDGTVYSVLEGPASQPSFDKNEKGIPISIYDQVKVEYELSFLDVVKDVDFMEKLQAKWQKYGYLPIDSEGKFSIISEVLKKG